MLRCRVLLSMVLGLAGAGLVAVNLYGYVRQLYHPEEHIELARPGDNELSFDQTLASIDGIEGSDRERAIALLNAVQRRMVDYDGPALRVHPADNWLLWGLSFVAPRFSRYEFVDPERALRRGLGLCGQQALALVGLLEERGFTAGRMRLRGHMTVWVRADGDEIMLDPYLGTVLPFAIEYAEANLDSVRRLYEETSAQQFSTPDLKARVVDIVVATYADDNKRTGPGLADSAGGGALAIERALYALKWAIPVLLLAASAWLGWRTPPRLRRSAVGEDIRTSSRTA